MKSEAATGGIPWKKGVFENFAKFTGARVYFIIKLQAWAQ